VLSVENPPSEDPKVGDVGVRGLAHPFIIAVQCNTKMDAPPFAGFEGWGAKTLGGTTFSSRDSGLATAVMTTKVQASVIVVVTVLRMTDKSCPG
jgi:hypothetical protein